MTVKMNKNIQEERYFWIKPIIDKKMKYRDVLKTCPHSKRSLERWVSLYKKEGIDALIPKNTKPLHSPNKTKDNLRNEVIKLKKKEGLCSQKIHWRLKKTKNINIPVSTVSKIIKDEGLTRKYRIKKIKYKHIKTSLSIGDIIEIDVKHVPGPIEGKKYQQYTAIDLASRWRYLKIYDEESTFNSIRFLKEIIKRFPKTIKAIKTDNHSTFTNYYLGSLKRSDMTVKTIHALDRFCKSKNIVHYLIDKGKPNQNGKVERSHREDQEKFYDKNDFKTIQELKRKIRIWNNYYNNLEHCGLDGKTPNEMLKSI